MARNHFHGCCSCWRRNKGILSIISVLIVASRASLSVHIPPLGARRDSRLLSSGLHRSLPAKPCAGRRTLSSMSLSVLQQEQGAPKYVRAEDFGSPRGLSEWLSTRLSPQFNSWGIEPGTKNITNLWMELMDAEISIEDSVPPKRTVNVASVNIKNGLGQTLIESHQEMDDGTIRLRNRPLSEKMKAGENVEAACLRGIYEELGPVLGSPRNVSLMLDSYTSQAEERSSLSYPGLLTCYVVHSVDAIIRHLPASDFSTDEDEEGRINGARVLSACGSDGREKAIGVKKHFWKWVPESA